MFCEKEAEGKTIKKARLVTRGYQQEDVGEEVYSPVARMLTISFLLSLSMQLDLFIHQLDVKTAFLNGKLKHPVYMNIPKGLKGNFDGKVCKLY